MWTNVKLLSLFIGLISLLSLADIVGGRGARFSGVRFRSSRSYRSYRGTRSYRGRSSYRSTRYGKYVAAAAAGYAVYGMTRYRSRYYGSPYYRSDPNICTNMERYVTYNNGTVSKTQKLTYFVCPYDSNDKENEIYCCGPALRHTCCSYWSSSKKVGPIVGIVIGSVVAISIAIFCCCKCSQSRRRKGSGVPPPAVYQPTCDAPVLLSDNGAPDHYAKATAPAGYYPNPGVTQPYPAAQPAPYPYQPEAPAYPPQPMPPADPNAIGFESTAPPPDYNAAVGYPTK